VEYVDVVIVGGGATGVGVARDLALRGVGVALVDRGDVADGTSGRNHGLLHSGGRYAVRDPAAAEECIRENLILREVAPHCIDPCAGLFVALEGDDPSYARRFEEACARATIETTRLGRREALEREPGLSERVSEAYLVPDAAVDPFFLCLSNAMDAAEHGAIILTHHEVVEVTRSDRVTGLVLANGLTGERRRIECRLVVNAAGPWAGKVAALAGVEVELVLSRGALVVTRGRLVRGVVNRMRPPSDGDIIVPGGPVCLLGTTSVTVGSPEDLDAGAEEADRLVAQGSELVPMIWGARIIREFAGIRPLYQEEAGPGDGRAVSRGFAVLDHEARDGLPGLVTVVGGKLTTYRLMAEKVADLVAARLGVDAPCTTATSRLPGSEAVERPPWPVAVPGLESRALEIRHGSRASRVLEGAGGLSRVCVCETVPEAEVRYAVRELFARTIDDVRRRTRLGMGPCQASTCAPRAAAIIADELGLAPAQADALLREFLLERRRGRLAVASHGGAAQEELIRSAERGLAAGEVEP
jgi:glycerol-3-phosphate dehydrogenase